VLHVGDSFVDAGLRQALGPKLATVGSRYLAVAKTGSYLGTWAHGSALRELLHAHQPALVLVTLGASEVNAEPPSIRLASVRGVVAQLKGRPCVWISFPLWKGAKTGLSDLIRRESAPCRHYDSQPLASRISRQRDGVHPDAKGGAVWGDAVATWLLAQRDPRSPPWGLLAAPAGEHK
jgi:lysophospholipase L1-like esterase